MPNSKTNSKVRAILSRNLANYLLQQGYLLVRIAEDRKNSNNSVFLFEDTPMLNQEIANYSKNK